MFIELRSLERFWCCYKSSNKNANFAVFLSFLQLLQTFPILCSTWITTLNTGKAWMSGSCTAWDPLLNRSCIVRLWGSVIRGSRFLSCWGGGGVSLAHSLQRVSSPSLSCFCSTLSINKSVHQEITVGLYDKALQQWLCWLYSAVRWQLWQTGKRHTAFLWLLMPLRL